MPSTYQHKNVLFTLIKLIVRFKEYVAYYKLNINKNIMTILLSNGYLKEKDSDILKDET